MKDDSTRRNFLRAAGIAMAGIAGASWASAQEQEKPENEKNEEEEPKEDEPNYDDLFGDNDGSEDETRACPQCGALMYLDGDTWYCENCGYSYVE